MRYANEFPLRVYVKKPLNIIHAREASLPPVLFYYYYDHPVHDHVTSSPGHYRHEQTFLRSLKPHIPLYNLHRKNHEKALETVV